MSTPLGGELTVTDVLRPRIKTTEVCPSWTGCGDGGRAIGTSVGDSLGAGEVIGCGDSPGVVANEVEAAGDGDSDGASPGWSFVPERALEPH